MPRFPAASCRITLSPPCHGKGRQDEDRPGGRADHRRIEIGDAGMAPGAEGRHPQDARVQRRADHPEHGAEREKGRQHRQGRMARRQRQVGRRAADHLGDDRGSEAVAAE